MSRHGIDEAAGKQTLTNASSLQASCTSSQRRSYPRIHLTTLVLKLYGIASMDPQHWEDVDHEKEGPLAGTMTGEDGGLVEEMDPLGLRGRLTG